VEKLPANFGCKGTQECDSAVKVSLTDAITPNALACLMPTGFAQRGRDEISSFPQAGRALLCARVTLRPRRHLDGRTGLDHIGRMHGLNHIYGICREIMR
jgi:hypothetical protein